MGRTGPLASILFVALVIGGALGAIFWPLMDYERLMGNATEYRIWVGEWIGFTVFLTLGLCRREIRQLLGGRKAAKAAAPSESSSTEGHFPE